MLASLCVYEHAHAQALPVTVSQNAVAGSFRQFLIRRGFAANDPRFASTMSGLGNTIAAWSAGAVAVVGTVVTAPAWLTVGVACLGVPLAQVAGESAAKWLWDYNHPKDITISSQGKAVDTEPLVKGGRYAYIGNGADRIEGGDPQQLARAAIVSRSGKNQIYNCTYNSPGWMVCGVLKYNEKNERWEHDGSISIEFESNSPHECSRGSYWAKTGCATYPLEYPDKNNEPQPIEKAIAAISPTELAKPINPQLISNLVNRAWQETAAKPGYNGLPYDYANPMTEEDAEKWLDENPQVWPKVADWVAPQDPVNKPWTLPNTETPTTSYDPATGANTGTNPAGSQPQINLGNDPGIPAPTLEEIPTAEAILKPVFGLLPDLKNFSAPVSGGSCPTPSFSAFDQTFRLDKHCDLAEKNRGAIKAAMFALFALSSLLIVLRA